jgi:hypothetical protein
VDTQIVSGSALNKLQQDQDRLMLYKLNKAKSPKAELFLSGGAL